MKHTWLNVRATKDTGVEGHFMLEGMFPRLKLERKSAPHRFDAANGKQFRDLGGETIPYKTHGVSLRRKTLRSASAVEAVISMQKVVRAGNISLLDEKNPHIRNAQDGTVIKLDANNGLCTMSMWNCLDGAGFSGGRDSKWPNRFR